MADTASGPKWWGPTFLKMTSAAEKFEYLSGLSGLSWDDCQDAWFEAKKLIPEVAKELRARDEEVRRLNLENQQLREVIQDWKKDCARFVQENKRLQDEIQRLTDKYDFQLLVRREERLREALERFKQEFDFKAKCARDAKTTHYSYTVRSLEEFSKACADALKADTQVHAQTTKENETMKDFAAKMFEGMPPELLEQAKKTNAAFKVMNSKREALEVARDEFDKAEADFKYEDKTYRRMINRLVPVQENSNVDF